MPMQMKMQTKANRSRVVSCAQHNTLEYLLEKFASFLMMAAPAAALVIVAATAASTPSLPFHQLSC